METLINDSIKFAVLRYLAAKGVCYTSELVINLNTSIDYINSAIHELLNLGLIQKHLVTDPESVLFHGRMQEFWYEHNIISIANFRRKSWWILSEKGIEFMKTNNPYDPINNSLIDFYDGKTVEPKIITLFGNQGW